MKHPFEKHERALSMGEFERDADLYEALEQLEQRLHAREVLPTQVQSVFEISNADIPPTTFMPAPIQRYREVGAAIDAYIYIDVTPLTSAVNMQVFCGSKDNMHIFEFERDIDSQHYTSTENGSEISVADIDIERAILELALSSEQQALIEPRLVIDELDRIHISGQATAFLLSNALERAARKVALQTTYDIPSSDDLPGSTLTITKEDFRKTIIFQHQYGEDDGPVRRLIDYTVTMQQTQDPDTTNVSYHTSAQAQRFIQLENTTRFVPDDEPDERAVIEHALECIKRTSQRIEL